ncbi:hypothetical protein pb186bvf_018896 [Paramecium bursaria]
MLIIQAQTFIWQIQECENAQKQYKVYLQCLVDISKDKNHFQKDMINNYQKNAQVIMIFDRIHIEVQKLFLKLKQGFNRISEKKQL